MSLRNPQTIHNEDFPMSKEIKSHLSVPLTPETTSKNATYTFPHRKEKTSPYQQLHT